MHLFTRIRLGLRLRSTFARLEAALGGAQARERFGIRGRDEVRKIRKAFANGRPGRDPVIPAREMRARARPASPSGAIKRLRPTA